MLLLLLACRLRLLLLLLVEVPVHCCAVAALSVRRVVEAYSKGGLLTNNQPEAQRKLL
jgi:hypothetical protein